VTIRLEYISKRYGFEWIFKQINYQFEPGGQYAIVGPNGSGKSTLLKIISGGLVPTAGKVLFSIPHKRIVDEVDVAKEITYAAPYISLIEDFTLSELYDFHASFKEMLTDSKEEFMEIAQLGIHQHKFIKNFSSGMKQRLKLALAFLTASQTIILDEPTTNFDAKAVEWYLSLVEKYAKDRILIIGSNQDYEYQFCSSKLSVMAYKG